MRCGGRLASQVAALSAPSGARRNETDMRLRVSVPVLSVHKTVAAPSVSIAAARRVNTLDCDSRHAPMTMKTVSTSGNSSGSSDMPTAIAPSRASSHEPRSAQYRPKASRLTTSPTAPNTSTIRRVCFSNRGCSRAIPARDAPIAPIALRSPVATTAARPVPRMTSVPEKT